MRVYWHVYRVEWATPVPALVGTIPRAIGRRRCPHLRRRCTAYFEPPAGAAGFRRGPLHGNMAGKFRRLGDAGKLLALSRGENCVVDGLPRCVVSVSADRYRRDR